MTDKELMQQHFDAVAKHLFAQGERCVISDGVDPYNDRCVYRGPNKTMCAIGALIPDELYDPEWDNSTKGGLNAVGVAKAINSRLAEQGKPRLFAEWESGKPTTLYGLLQSVHDNGRVWEDSDLMRKALEQVANSHDLSPAILPTLSFKDR